MPVGRRSSLLSLACALACGGGGSTRSAPIGPPPPNTGPSPVAVENAKPGGSGWRLHHCSAGALEAYASAASVDHGEPLDVHVRSDGATQITWEAWRMGWYGGAGGRSVARGGPVAGGPQATPSPAAGTGLVACRWPVTFTVQTGADWTSGVYLLVIARKDGAQTQVPFVVRADERKGAGVFQASFTTYQAYNAWGGTSLYDGGPAVEVSFDRPYLQGCGSGQFFRYEYDFLRWAESRGFDLTYVTNLDVDRDASLLQGQRIFLSVGHDEYWSRPARQNVESALRAGTSLAFFSANAVYWQIRLEPSRDDGRPRRTQVCWKKRADTEDPQRGTPLETTKWELPPVSDPANALLGVGYHSWNGDTPAPWVVKNASAWPYEGTGVKDGDAIPGIVGYETDRTIDNGLTPPGVTVLAESPVTGHDGGTDLQQAAVRDLPNGAFVFAAGTIEWSWGLAKDGVTDPRVQRITENVLRRAGLAPAP